MAATTDHAPSEHDAPAVAFAARGFVALARRGRRSLRAAAPWVTALLLFATTSGAADVAHDLLGLESLLPCCGEPCDEGAGECDPGSCGECRCHAQPSAVSLAAPLVVDEPLVQARTFGGAAEETCAPGYRASPFRPPTA